MTGLPTRRLGRTQANLHAIGLGGAWWGAAGRDETVELPGKVVRRLSPGDRVRIETPGGGGHGASENPDEG